MLPTSKIVTEKSPEIFNAITQRVNLLDAGIFNMSHFIPIVGVGNERRILISPWGYLKRQHRLELP